MTPPHTPPPDDPAVEAAGVWLREHKLHCVNCGADTYGVCPCTPGAEYAHPDDDRVLAFLTRHPTLTTVLFLAAVLACLLAVPR